MGELYDKLNELEYEDILPMHMPGAKRNSRLFGMSDAVKLDITEVSGFDNLHHADGVIKKCADNAAELYGADEAFLLVNGSTAGIIAAICGATKPNDKVIVARNVHCSVINGLYLGQLNPVYVYPKMVDENAGIYGAVRVEDVEKAFEVDAGNEFEDNKLNSEINSFHENDDFAGNKFDKKNSADIKAVIITSPTYEGIVSDVAAIAEVAHRHGAVLIVDEAHGAHFGLHGAFPENAVRQGADAVIMSLHKTLPSLTQTALLAVNRGRIDVERVRMFWNIMQSTSPSYVLMGSIDRCISILQDSGNELFEAYVARLQKLIFEIKKLKYIRILETDDISKLVLLVSNGSEFAKRLREIYKIELEMASEKYVIAMTSIGDTDEGYVRFIQAMRNLDVEEFAYDKLAVSSDVINESPQISISIYAALNSETEEVPLECSAGRVAGAALCIYPPGINLVNPGEIITENVVGILKSGMQHGLEVLGVNENENVKVVI
jgi:arginine/lysine/ornithine decarboxylase